MGNLASAVDELLGMDVPGLGDDVLVEELVEIGRQIERLQAARLARLAVLDARGIGDREHAGSTAGWLRAVGAVSPGRAAREVRLARDLLELPVVAAALGDGRIGVEHAQVIAGLRRDLPAAAVSAAEPHLVDAASRLNPAELRGWAAHVRHAYAPDRVLADEQDQHAERTLSAASTFRGTGVGRWVLPPVAHETVLTAIHAFSAPQPGDDRSPGQRRADALVTIAEIALAAGAAPQAGGVKPHVSVLVPLDTLERRAGAPAATYGYGATSSADWARRLCCDAGLSRLIAGPDSAVLDAGRQTRSFTAAQTRALHARDRHCRWPGCDRPAGWCEAHHIQHWADGGPTSLDNAVLLCGRHHDRVHLHAHRVFTHPDGTVTVDPTPGSAHHQERSADIGPRADLCATGPPTSAGP